MFAVNLGNLVVGTKEIRTAIIGQMQAINLGLIAAMQFIKLCNRIFQIPSEEPITIMLLGLEILASQYGRRLLSRQPK